MPKIRAKTFFAGGTGHASIQMDRWLQTLNSEIEFIEIQRNVIHKGEGFTDSIFIVYKLTDS
jgi:hypothetical protein